MVRRYTFPGVILIYERLDDKHRLAVELDTERPSIQESGGPWVTLDTPLTFEWNGRFFIGQGYTELLPYVFELVPAKETTLEIPLTNDRDKPN